MTKKKRNFFQKFWLKINNPIAYCYEYGGLTQIIEKEQIKANEIARNQSDEYIKKFLVENEKNFIRQIQEINQKVQTQIPHLQDKAPYEELYKNFNEKINKLSLENAQNFKHSGHLGDLIYSLPTAISIADNQKIDFYVNTQQKNFYDNSQKHFGGATNISKKSFEMLKPLLENQEYIKSIQIFDENTHKIDCDFDIFRELPIFLNRGNIANWYFYVFGQYYNLSKAWIKVTPNQKFKDFIILARSNRYNNPCINYRFLQKYDNILFVGMDYEYEEMKKNIPNLTYQPINNFLELTEIIAGSKFFIGNQSFPYSLAEALKTPRVLELFYQNPNVIPQGENAFDFYFQEHFEKLVKKLNTF